MPTRKKNKNKTKTPSLLPQDESKPPPSLLPQDESKPPAMPPEQKAWKLPAWKEGTPVPTLSESTARLRRLDDSSVGVELMEEGIPPPPPAPDPRAPIVSPGSTQAMISSFSSNSQESRLSFLEMATKKIGNDGHSIASKRQVGSMNQSLISDDTQNQDRFLPNSSINANLGTPTWGPLRKDNPVSTESKTDKMKPIPEDSGGLKGGHENDHDFGGEDEHHKS